MTELIASDADRRENISHNGSSGFGGNADSAEAADLGRAPHQRADRTARFLGHNHRLFKK